jgi:FKBP-type peptidyl-prolyl cis-trans isomerase 2
MFFRSKKSNADPPPPIPRWQSWLLFGFLGYLVIVGNINTTSTPHTTTPPQELGASSVTQPPDEVTDFPAIRHALSLSHWKGALNPNRTDGLTVRDFNTGHGRQAACGDTVTLTIRGRTSKGELFDTTRDETKPVTFTIGEKTIYPAVEQGVIGMRVGGERIIDTPSALVYDAKNTAKELSLLTLQVNMTSITPKFQESAAPLLFTSTRDTANEPAQDAACGMTIPVSIRIWNATGAAQSATISTKITLGKREWALGLDQALVGIAIGETRSILLPTHYQLHHGTVSPLNGKTMQLVDVTRTK